MRPKRIALLTVNLIAILLIFTSAAPAGAKGPYCSSYCQAWRACNAGCYDDEGSYTTCASYGAVCGICDSCTNYIWGTNGPDNLHQANSTNDCIYAYDGDDDIDSGAGDDRVWAGNGDDDVNASSGDDCLYGEGGSDNLAGETGYDYASGGSGGDTCTAESEVSCEY